MRHADLGRFEITTESRLTLRVEEIGGRGRAIIAVERIQSGVLIERSPVLIIPDEHRRSVDMTNIFTYHFMWENGMEEEDLYKHVGRSALALGYTSLLNHSYQPNCRVIRHIEYLAIDLVALRDIQAGEELTIDYQMTLWFDPE